MHTNTHKLSRNSRGSWAAAVALIAIFPTGSAVVAQTGGPYDLSWNTVDGGGATFSTGGSYSLGGTVGQPDPGPGVAGMSGGSYALNGGFWPGALGTPTPTPTATFIAAPYTVAEGGGSALISVSLSNAAAQTVSVNYATSNGSAMAAGTGGGDYVAASGTLTWLAGDMSPKSFAVAVLQDGLSEGSETVNLTLSAPVNCTIGAPNPTTLTIIDDDAALVTIVSANPPSNNQGFVPPPALGPFRDVLQTGTSSALTQGIGVAGTPAEGTVTYGALTVTFSGTPVPAPTAANIDVACTGGACPTVVPPVAGSGTGPYTITLSGPIPSKQCTTLTFAGTVLGQKLQYQYLPGDVGLGGSTSALDVQQLVAAIGNGQAANSANLPRYDVNRNGNAGNSDVLRLIGLLNGVNTTQPWAGATVAACP